MTSTDLWPMLTAIGTLSAVGASVTFGVLEGFKGRRDRKELVAVRAEARDQERRRHERERIASASLVTAWITDTFTPDPQAEGYRRQLTLHVANESNEPVVNASLNVYLGNDSRLVGPLAAPSPIPVVPPRRELTWDITSGIAAHEDSANVLVELGFTDSEGRRWYRDLDGILSESTGKDVFHYAEENLERAQQQLGEPDPHRNPMSVAFLFANLLWGSPEDFDIDVLLSVLDPVAPGWEGEWSSERIDQLRALVSEYNNLATLAWYSAPKVAYARLFSDSALRQVTKAGTELIVEGRFITLVHRGDLGWKVFGVGPKFRPDEIHFPEFAVETHAQSTPDTTE